MRGPLATVSLEWDLKTEENSEATSVTGEGEKGTQPMICLKTAGIVDWDSLLHDPEGEMSADVSDLVCWCPYGHAECI